MTTTPTIFIDSDPAQRGYWLRAGRGLPPRFFRCECEAARHAAAVMQKKGGRIVFRDSNRRAWLYEHIPPLPDARPSYHGHF